MLRHQIINHHKKQIKMRVTQNDICLMNIWAIMDANIFIVAQPSILFHMCKMRTVILAFWLIITASTLYEQGSQVRRLKSSFFDDLVFESDEFWVVNFYAPWCEECKKVVPEYLKAAGILAGIINFGAVDISTDYAVSTHYQVVNYPTIKLFGANKNKPIDFAGLERTCSKLVEFSLAQLKKQVEFRKKMLNSEPESQQL